MWRSFLEMWRRGLQGTWRYHSSLSIRLTPTAVVGKSRLYPSIELEGARFEIGLAAQSSMVVRGPPKDLCEHSDVQHCRALTSVCQDFLNCSVVAILHQCNRCPPRQCRQVAFKLLHLQRKKDLIRLGKNMFTEHRQFICSFEKL